MLGDHHWYVVTIVLFVVSALNAASTPSAKHNRMEVESTPQRKKGTPTASTPTGSNPKGSTPSRAKTSLQDLLTPNHKQKLVPKNVTPSQRVGTWLWCVYYLNWLGFITCTWDDLALILVVLEMTCTTWDDLALILVVLLSDWVLMPAVFEGLDYNTCICTWLNFSTWGNVGSILVLLEGTWL